MKEWYAAKELAGLPGMPGTERSVNRKAQKEQWRFQDVPAPGGPGGKRREYHLSSIPEETRIALLEAEAGIVTMDETAFREYLSSCKISLTPAEIADPIMQAKIACAKAFENMPAYGGREKLLETLAAKYGKSKQQIRRWIEDVQDLRTRSVHRIKLGEERVELPASSSFSPEALACGLSSYANDMKAGIKAAYRKMEENSNRSNGSNSSNGEEWRLGDYVSFTRIVKKIPPSIWLRIQKGATGFELHGLPKIIRKWTAVPVQSVICGDQKIFDYVTYDPETDALIKPEGYFWMDCSSRMITGAWIELSHYNQYTVGNSLREALRWGMPDEIFTDWGKPEGSRHITHIRAGLSGYSNTDDYLAMRDKYGDISDDVGHKKAQPGKPWAKPIENIMNIFDTRLKAKNLPGYRKRNADAWENKEVQELLKKQAKHGALMHIQDFITAVFDTIDEHNKAEKKLAEGGTIVPRDFFFDGLVRQPRTVFTGYALDYICLPTFERKPRQATVAVTVRSNDHRSYYSPALSGRKKPVRVCVDPYDRDAPAALIDDKGEVIDMAEPWGAQDNYDQPGLAAKRKHQAQLMRWVGEQARRVRTGFELYKSEIKDREVIKVTSATATAKEIEKETKVYHLRKIEEKQEADRYRAIAAEEQRSLERRFAAEGNVLKDIDPWVLDDGRDKYAYYMKIKGCLELNKPLTDKEADFYARYPQTADYRVCNDLYEESGDLFLIGGMI